MVHLRGMSINRVNNDPLGRFPNANMSEVLVVTSMRHEHVGGTAARTRHSSLNTDPMYDAEVDGSPP